MGETKETAESGENRKADGRFGPGNCANPGGRPRMSPEEREAWQALSTKCRIKLEEIAARDDVQPAILCKIAELSTDRGYGKAVQAIDLGASDGSKVEFSFVDAPNTSPE